MKNHRVKIRKLDKLIYQLGHLRREYTEAGKLKIKVVEGVHDDYADAFALACRVVQTGDTWHIMEMDPKFRRAMFG